MIKTYSLSEYAETTRSQQDQDWGRAGNTEHNTVNTVAGFAAENNTKRKQPTIPTREVSNIYPSNPLRSAIKDQCSLTPIRKEGGNTDRNGLQGRQAPTVHTSRAPTSDRGKTCHKNMGKREEGGKDKRNLILHTALAAPTSKVPTTEPSAPSCEPIKPASTAPTTEQRMVIDKTYNSYLSQHFKVVQMGGGVAGDDTSKQTKNMKELNDLPTSETCTETNSQQDIPNAYSYLKHAPLLPFEYNYSLSEYAETIRSLQEGSLPIMKPPPHPKEHPILNILPATFEDPHNVLRRVLHIQDKNVLIPPLGYCKPQSILSCLPNLYSDNAILDDALIILCSKYTHTSVYASNSFGLFLRGINEDNNSELADPRTYNLFCSAPTLSPRTQHIVFLPIFEGVEGGNGHNVLAAKIKRETVFGGVADEILYFDSLNFEPSTVRVSQIKAFLQCSQDTSFVKIKTPQQGEVECMHRVIFTAYLLATHCSYKDIEWHYFLNTSRSTNQYETGYALRLFSIACLINLEFPSLDLNDIPKTDKKIIPKKQPFSLKTSKVAIEKKKDFEKK